MRSMPPDHVNPDRYLRYHQDVHWPLGIAQAVAEFLPPPGQPFTLSPHYRRIQADRHLPDVVRMPSNYTVIEATVTKDTRIIYRVLLRFVFNQRSDLAVVLEGDWEMVTAFWQSPNDWHQDTLDTEGYVKEEDDDITL